MSSDGPVLQHVLAGQHENHVTACMQVTEVGGTGGDTGVLTVGEDKVLLVWLLRDNGEYYPSARKDLPSVGRSLSFDQDANRIYAGMDNGQIICFNVASDWNSLTVQRTFQAHEGRVVGMEVDQSAKIILSAGKDKKVKMHSTETGEKLAEYALPGPAYSLEYAPEATTVFVGDGNGMISILKIMEKTSFKKLVVVAGHQGAVTALHWEQSNEFLYSGGNDKLVVAWDMGGQKGHRYELRGQKGKIRGLEFDRRSNQLLAVTESSFFCWDMSGQRFSNPEWKESDTCMNGNCGKTFFWNVKKMWEDKDVGLNRQHHCRACGNAICGDATCCSPTKIILTRMGHETPVRVCTSCAAKVSEADRTLRAKVIELPFKTGVSFLDMSDASSATMLNAYMGTVHSYQIQSGVVEGAGITVAAYHKKTSLKEGFLKQMGEWGMGSLFGGDDAGDTDSAPSRMQVPVSSAAGAKPGGGGGRAAQLYQVGGDEDDDARPSLAASILNDDDDAVASPFA